MRYALHNLLALWQDEPRRMAASPNTTIEASVRHMHDYRHRHADYLARARQLAPRRAN